MPYKVIDLYAGVGGFSYGFAQDDDFEIIAANEILGSWQMHTAATRLPVNSNQGFSEIVSPEHEKRRFKIS